MSLIKLVCGTKDEHFPYFHSSCQLWLKTRQPILPYPHPQFRRHCTMYVGEKSPKRQIASMMPDGQEMCEKCTYIIWQKKNSSDTCCCKLWSQKWKIKRLTAKAWSFFSQNNIHQRADIHRYSDQFLRYKINYPSLLRPICSFPLKLACFLCPLFKKFCYKIPRQNTFPFSISNKGRKR